MKKIILVLLSAMMIMMMFGCTEKKSEPEVNETVQNETPDTTDEVLGGWNVVDNNEAKFDDETADVFNTAVEALVGVELKPVALLGTQLVSGTNYAFLCESTGVTESPEKKYVICYVYEDLNGETSVLSINRLFAEEDDKPVEELLGGWTVAENTFAEANENCKNVLTKALEGFVGSDFELVACVSHQVVAGLNHEMLCKQTLVTKDPVVKYSLVTVYEAADGNVTISDIKGVTLSIDDEAGSK